MLILNAKVFAASVEGTTSVYTPAEFNDILGQPDSLSIQVIATQITVAGGTPTVEVQVETGTNDRDFANLSASPEIPATTLTAGLRNVVSTSTPIANAFGFVRLRVQLGGTSPKADLEIWVAGRDPRVV